MPDLSGCVALVAGATRGGGRGVAIELGRAGATVYVTGRSSRAGGSTEGLPGTVDETAEEVTARGGRGIAVVCDHTDAVQVAALFTRVREEQGRLDLLVSNAWSGYEGHDVATFSAPFWQQPLEERWQKMFVAGVRAHLLAAQAAAPLMLVQRAGLIISTVAWSAGDYLGNLVYDAAKATLVRLVFGMAQELRPYNVAAVALAPGFVRTERVLAAHAAHPFDLSGTESPEYLGRAVTALAADAEVMARTGQALTAGDLAREYGFTDVDGTQPAAFRMPASPA
jgi:NAD(P)-dependent dehydrogenase (short-subunit alcohol dehydrogenase family)